MESCAFNNSAASAAFTLRIAASGNLFDFFEYFHTVFYGIVRNEFHFGRFAQVQTPADFAANPPGRADQAFHGFFGCIQPSKALTYTFA